MDFHVILSTLRSMPKKLTAHQFAEMLHITERTVYRWSDGTSNTMTWPQGVSQERVQEIFEHYRVHFFSGNGSHMLSQFLQRLPPEENGNAYWHICATQSFEQAVQAMLLDAANGTVAAPSEIPVPASTTAIQPVMPLPSTTFQRNWNTENAKWTRKEESLGNLGWTRIPAGWEAWGGDMPRKHRNKLLYCLAGGSPRRPAPDNVLTDAGMEITLASGRPCTVLYKEIVGSQVPEKQEFFLGKNISFAYTQQRAAIQNVLPDYAKRLADRQRKLEEQEGYLFKDHDMLWLRELKEQVDPFTGETTHLRLVFGGQGYHDHFLLVDWLIDFDEGGDLTAQGRQFYQDHLSAKRGNVNFSSCAWSACGNGVWVLTRDNYLLLSWRTHVTDLKGRFSYSASGSTDRWMEEGTTNGNLIQSAADEVVEELGLPRELANGRNLILFNVGIDLARCIVQFSYLLKVDLTLDEITGRYVEHAVAAREQETFAVPFCKDAILYLLEHYDMEVGAAFSLYRLMQKNEL